MAQRKYADDSRYRNLCFEQCHVRLAQPGLAYPIVSYFATHPTIQKTGLDDQGLPATSKSNGIIVEILNGVREERYWSKLPEKVRIDALKRAGYGIMEDEDVQVGRDGDGSKKRRKG